MHTDVSVKLFSMMAADFLFLDMFPLAIPCKQDN